MTKPEPMELTSQKITEEQKAKLRQLFPEVFTEGKVDFDRLKLTLGEEADDGAERYGMSWPGKRDCFKVIQQPSAGTLKPCKAESVNFDDTENLFIEGDNLEALKLLQKSYYGKVKMIYIDPPYNTGKEFIYPDNWKENLDTYLEYTGQVDESGKKFSTNTEAEGRFHSKWLNMMYPRLFLARNLLRDDGVIFISIDDNEVSNLRKLCDEIFGEENFVESITWNKRIPKNDKGIGNIHEYVLIYVKDSSYEHEFTMSKDGLEDIDTLLGKLKSSNIPLKDAEQELRKLYAKKGYDRGITLYNSLNSNYELWGKINVSWPNGLTNGPRYDVLHPKTKAPVKVPERGWRWKRETFDSLLDYKHVIELHDGSYMCGNIWFAEDENTQPSQIKYLKEVDTMLLRSIISLKSDGGMEVENMLGGKNIMSYPKPTELIKVLTDSVSAKDAVILDFFAGSATTAHAVLELNKEDGGNRKFIMVQLPEPCDEASEAFKAGYKTIAEIGKERIRRVIKQITTENTEHTEKEKADNPLFHQDKDSVSSVVKAPGFKVFKLGRSNFKAWQAEATDGITAEALSKQLELGVDHIDSKSTPDDILYELLMKSGFELTAKVETLKLADKTIYSVAGGALLICLEPALTKEVITAMAKLSPARVLCLDRGFAGNDQLKTNAVQIMKSHEVEDFRTV